MILFESDWFNYPTAIINLQTTNHSFIRLASVYRSMGVKNHAFILALVNPDLVGIDPFSENLTVEEMTAIAVECKENPWFFFREIARAPAISGVGSVPLEANRGNIALFWSFFNHIMIILIQIRQTGKSFSTDVLMTLLQNILCQNTAINLMTKDDILRRKNIERLKEIASELPRYLQQRTREDANNGEEITIKSLGNTYTTHVPQSSPKRAYNMGRGLTSPIFHVDEPPFQPNISIALPAALAATGAAVDSAKAKGTPYGTILTTTAGKKDDKDGKFVYKLLSDAAVWTEKFYDAANLTELEKMVLRHSRGNVCRINATFNHRQLGKTDQWLKEKLDESLQTGDDANRDYFNMWTSGSQTNPLPLALLEKIVNSCMGVMYTSISKQGYLTRWYIPENEIEWRMANGKYVLGMDTSEASGGDAISLVLMDVDTMEVIAGGTYNETNLITFSMWVASFLIDYENITAVIERRSTGAMLLDYLLVTLPQHGIDPFKRLFNTLVHEHIEMKERYAEIRQPMNRRTSDIYVRYKKMFGFATSGSGYASRSELYSTTLMNAAKRGGDRVHDKDIIDQISGLITKNGRIDHDDGEHDDMVIGWLLCVWLLTQGKNLSHYGIERVMTAVSSKTKEEETPLDAMQRYEQQRIRERIEAVYNELSSTQDDYVCMRLEHELLSLDRQIILEDGEVYAVDDLLRQASEARKGKRRNYDNRQQQQQHGSVYYQPAVVSDRPLSVNEMYRR
jgi:hypothetical protein